MEKGLNYKKMDIESGVLPPLNNDVINNVDSQLYVLKKDNEILRRKILEATGSESTIFSVRCICSELETTRQLKEEEMNKRNNLERQISEQKNILEAIYQASYPVGQPNPSFIEKEIDSLSNKTIIFVQKFGNLLENENVGIRILNLLQPKAKLSDSLSLQKALAGFLINDLFLDFENDRFEREGCSMPDTDRRCSSYFGEWRTLGNSDAVSARKSSKSFDDFVSNKWQSFRTNLLDSFKDKKDLVSEFIRRNSVIESSFVSVAMAAWKLHRLSLSFNPPAILIRVKEGTPVKWQSISIRSLFDEVKEEEEGRENATVAFVIFPGFRIKWTVFPCQVYPSFE